MKDSNARWLGIPVQWRKQVIIVLLVVFALLAQDLWVRQLRKTGAEYQALLRSLQGSEITKILISDKDGPVLKTVSEPGALDAFAKAINTMEPYWPNHPVYAKTFYVELYLTNGQGREFLFHTMSPTDRTIYIDFVSRHRGAITYYGQGMSTPLVDWLEAQVPGQVGILPGRSLPQPKSIMPPPAQPPQFWFPTLTALWCFLSLFFSFLSGWYRLARVFRATKPPAGEAFYFRGACVGIVPYRGILNFYTTPEGMFVAPLYPFRLGHPTLFIPWDEIHLRRVGLSLWLRGMVVCTVGDPKIATITFPWKIFERQCAPAKHL